MGIPTWIMLMYIAIGFDVTPITIKGYGSIAECETAAKYVVEQNIARRAKCFPGPVEIR